MAGKRRPWGSASSEIVYRDDPELLRLLNDVADVKDTASAISSNLETNRSLIAAQAEGLNTTNTRLSSIEVTLNGGSGIGAGGPWKKEGLVQKVDKITDLLTGFQTVLTWTFRSAVAAAVTVSVGAWLSHIGLIGKAVSPH